MKTLKFENAVITEQEGQLVVTEDIEGSQVSRNLNKELSIYFGVPNLNLKLTKTPKPAAEKKPVAKYVCPGCGKKVTSKDNDLEIRCITCNEEFVQPE